MTRLHPADRRADRRADRGSASVWLLGVGLSTMVLLGALLAVASAVLARHQAQAAADLGALAGALRVIGGESVACDRAADIVAANGARLVRCTVAGPDVTVTAEVEARVVRAAARATARAGPVRAVGQGWRVGPTRIAHQTRLGWRDLTPSAAAVCSRWLDASRRIGSCPWFSGARSPP